MKKRLIIDNNFRIKFKKNEFKLIIFKYLNSYNNNKSFIKNWKNKSFKLVTRSLKSRVNSKIRNFCIISGRGRGLSKNYFSLSRNSFKYLHGLGLLTGVFKDN